MSNDTNDDLPATQPRNKRRRVIHATCTPHWGPVGRTTLVLSTHSCVMVLEPHAAGTRKITLDDNGARALRGALTERLG